MKNLGLNTFLVFIFVVFIMNGPHILSNVLNGPHFCN